MSSVPIESLHSELMERLTPHGSQGLRAGIAGVIDLDALEKEEYRHVLESVDTRLSRAQYSIVSMLVAGVYFGVLVGAWLVSFVSWGLILRWAVPVLVVTIYAVYSSYQTLHNIRRLSEARALLRSLADRTKPTSES